MVDIWNSTNNILLHKDPGGGCPFGKYLDLQKFQKNQGGLHFYKSGISINCIPDFQRVGVKCGFDEFQT